KAGQFTSNTLIRNIIGQAKSTIDIRKIMDEGKILIMNLSKGKIGEDNSRLLGALMITRLQLAAMSRVDVPEDQRRDFYLHVDEFQNFATDSFKYILSEARKYHLCLTLAHQYITQMEETVRDAIFGNVGTLCLFRVGATDAEFLENEFSPEFTADDLVNLALGDIYLKLMIDGVASRPFSAHGIPPMPIPTQSFKNEIIEKSRQKYSAPRAQVEEVIRKWAEPAAPAIAAAAGQPFEERAAAPQKPGFESECWECGQKTTTPFQPDGKRPVYCKECLEKFKRGEILPRASIPPSPPRRPEPPVRYREVAPPPRRSEPPRPAPRDFSRSEPTRMGPIGRSSFRPEPIRRETPKTVSLSEALKSDTLFKKIKIESEPEPKKRKEVDLGDLRKTLEESLKNVSPREKNEKEAEGENEQKKTVKPGETVKFT
ncbi:MAG: TraM recognition domain-containing protein, partial [bacterium]|nr:TraM recognition domain-containing protein [bacterium]